MTPDLPLNQVPGDDGAAEALNAPLARIAVVVGDLAAPDPAWGLDTVVNAANEGLLGGGGVDGAIHQAAGPDLLAFTRGLGGCPTGLAKLSPAFGLERAGIRRILHAVGPVWSGVADTGVPGAPGDETAALGYTLEDTRLASCYASCLRLAVEAGARVVGFPAISTGACPPVAEPGAERGRVKTSAREAAEQAPAVATAKFRQRSEPSGGGPGTPTAAPRGSSTGGYGFPIERATRIAFGHVFGHFSGRPAPELPERVVFVCFDEATAAVYREVIATRAGWMLGRRRA